MYAERWTFDPQRLGGEMQTEGAEPRVSPGEREREAVDRLQRELERVVAKRAAGDRKRYPQQYVILGEKYHSHCGKVERLFNCGPRSSLIFSMFTVFGTTLLCLCFTLVSLHQLRGLQSQIREAQAQKEEFLLS
jgi:hypothetical protein